MIAAIPVSSSSALFDFDELEEAYSQIEAQQSPLGDSNGSNFVPSLCEDLSPLDLSPLDLGFQVDGSLTASESEDLYKVVEEDNCQGPTVLEKQSFYSAAGIPWRDLSLENGDSFELRDAADDGESANATAEVAKGYDTDDSVCDVSEVWPADIPAYDALLDDLQTDILGQLCETSSERDEDDIRAWEVVVQRCLVRAEPSLDAQIAGVCSKRELLFESPFGNPFGDGWVEVDRGGGYVLIDGSKKDPALGFLIQRFHLDGVPRPLENEVMGLLRDGWREARAQKIGILRLPVICKLRKAAEDAVSAAAHESLGFDIETFELSFRRDVTAALASGGPGFFGAVRSLLLTPQEQLNDGQKGWHHGPSIIAGTAQGICPGVVENLLVSMRLRSLPSKEDAAYIVSAAKLLLDAQPSLTDLTLAHGVTLHVVGDVHGQFWDFLHILEMCGDPSPRNQYLFNGDFVDRGQFSVEVALALLAMKAAWPTCVHLNRGNHEAMRMNTIYGFLTEATQKYSSEMFYLFSEAFQGIPLATVVNKSVLIVHGGLSSRDGVRLEQIARLNRKREPDEQADPLMLELMWSDPMDRPGRERSPRGGGVLFGPDVTRQFCEDNGLACIIRSHEMKQEGHEWQQQKMCLTVFSAPNYCDISGNLGAVCDITPRLGSPKLSISDLTVRTFKSSPHPA